MGNTKRNGANVFRVDIAPLAKTCPREAGIAQLNLPDGAKIIALGHAYFPSHDRSIMGAVKKYLADQKPDVVVILGGWLHEEAFKDVVDDGKDIVTELIGSDVPPEIDEVIKQNAGLEQRFLALAKICGQFIAELAKISGGHVYYIPSVARKDGNEIDIMRFVVGQKERMDVWADKHPDEAVKGPPIPHDFAEFLGVHKNPQVHVLPFGSALQINHDTLFIVGDFLRRHPSVAPKVDQEQTGKSVVRSLGGKVSSSFFTSPISTFPESERRYWQCHEVGNLFDFTMGLGYLRDYDRRAKGVWIGGVYGGKIIGSSYPFLTGQDGRRGFVVDGMSYDEDEPGRTAKIISLPTPPVKAVKAQKKGSKKIA